MNLEPQNLYWLGIGKGKSDLVSLDNFDRIVGFDARDVAHSLSKVSKKIIFERVFFNGIAGKSTFRTYSVSDFSSLSEIESLNTIYPNIKETRAEDCFTQDVSTLLQDVKSAEKNTLIVDVIDISLSILKGLAKSKILFNFNNVIIFCSTERLFENSPTAQEVYSFMDKNGFELSLKFGNDPKIFYIQFTYSKYHYTSIANAGKYESEVSENKKLFERLKRSKKQNKKRVEELLQLCREERNINMLSGQNFRSALAHFEGELGEIKNLLDCRASNSIIKEAFLVREVEQLSLYISLFSEVFSSKIALSSRASFISVLNEVLKNSEFTYLRELFGSPSLFFANSKNSQAIINLLLNNLEASKNIFLPSSQEMSLTDSYISALENFSKKITSGKKACTKFTDIEVLAKVELGDAWAANTVNSIIFRQDALVTRDGFQFGAFYKTKSQICFFKRELKTGALEFAALAGVFNINDAHNSISIGIDLKGYIHTSYDHHGSELKYRRSVYPLDISKWQDETSLTGKNEQKVTYPSFISSTVAGKEFFMLLYRVGNHIAGKTILNLYNDETNSWTQMTDELLFGKFSEGQTTNAYCNTPVVDNAGNIQLSYVWRTEFTDENQFVNNSNIGFIKSTDSGKTWLSSKGRPMALPITPVNSEVIWAIGPDENLMNQCSMTSDSFGNPHIAFYSNDRNGIVQYKHLWFDGAEWKCNIISERKEAFDLSGKGTLKVPLSRPEIICDKGNNIFVIYRADFTKDRLAVLPLKFPYYTYNSNTEIILDEENLFSAEPIIDRSRWKEEKVLSIYFQSCEQVNHEGVSDRLVASPARVLDFKFTNG